MSGNDDIDDDEEDDDEAACDTESNDGGEECGGVCCGDKRTLTGVNVLLNCVIPPDKLFIVYWPDCIGWYINPE